MKKVMEVNSKILLILLCFIMIFCTFNNSFVYAAESQGAIYPQPQKPIEEIMEDFEEDFYGKPEVEQKAEQETQIEESISTEFNPDDWNPGVEYGKTAEDGERTLPGETRLTEIANKIIGPVGVVGSFASVIAMIVMGVKYMLGSIEEKSQYKQSLGPYFIGAVMVFGISTVVTIIYNVASSFN